MPTVHFYNPSKYEGRVLNDITDPRKNGGGLTKEQRKSLSEKGAVTLIAEEQERAVEDSSDEPLGKATSVAGNNDSTTNNTHNSGGNALASPQSHTDTRSAEWPLRGIIAPGNNDYLLVRGRSKHPGNAEFHRKIDASNIAYNASSEKKSVVTARFVREWREQDPPGRFLKRNIQGLWDDVGDDKALLTVGLKIRRKQSPKAPEGNAISSPLEQSALTVHSSNSGKIPPTNGSNTSYSVPTTVVLSTVLSSAANGRESLLATASTAQGTTNVAEFAMLASQTVRNTDMLPAPIRPSHEETSPLEQVMISARESSGQADVAGPPTLSFLNQCLTVIGFPWGQNSRPQLAEPLDSMAEDGSGDENRPFTEISESKSLREPMRPLKKRKVVGEETAVQEASPPASENSMPSIAQERRAADQQQLEAKIAGWLENERLSTKSEELAAGLGGKLPGSSLEQKRPAAENPPNESPATADRQGIILANIQQRKQLLALVRASRVQLERRSECFDDRRLSAEIADFNRARMTAEETARRKDKRRRHHSTEAASANAAEAGTVRPVVGGRVAVTFKEGDFEGTVTAARFDTEQNTHKITVSWDCGDPDEELSYPGTEGGIRLLGGTGSWQGQPEVKEEMTIAGDEREEAARLEQERLLAEESTKAVERERLQEETREAARLEAEKKARLESERQERERLAAKEAARDADQKRLQEERRVAEQEHLEEAKKARLDVERQERERLVAEEAAKAAEQERMQEAEERARLEAERQERERLAAEVAATAAEKKRLEEEWQTAKKKRLDEEQQLASLQAERQERERLAAKRRVAAEQERLEEEKKARREPEQLERKRLAAEEAAEAAEQERMQEERRVAEQEQLEEEKQLASLEPSMLERERIAADRLEEKGPFAEQKQSARFEAAEHEEAKVKAKPDQCKPEPSVPTRGSSVIDVEYACLNKPGRGTRSVRKRKIKYTEPSLNSKLRRGDVLFPVEEEK